jgi:uncharacterized metal-binding protein YceD (DUF177 family)
MTSADLPLQRVYNLSHLSEAGHTAECDATPEECARIAAWAQIEAVGRFRARIDLKRLGPARFSFRATLEAEIVQACVVTLEPVEARLALDVARTLQLVRTLRPVDDFTLDGGDDAEEEIDNPRFNLAGPLLEEFSLAIDPYPHRPGVAFEAPADAQAGPENPFARLKVLKKQG